MAFSFQPHPTIKPPARAGKATAEYLQYNLAKFQGTVRHLHLLSSAFIPMYGLYPEQAVLAIYHLSLWLQGKAAITGSEGMQAIVMQHLADPQRLLPLKAFPDRNMVKKYHRLTDACAIELGLAAVGHREERIRETFKIKLAPFQELRPVTMTECLLAAIEEGNPLLGVLVCSHYERVYRHPFDRGEEVLDWDKLKSRTGVVLQGVPSDLEWGNHARDFLKGHITPGKAAELIRGE